MTRSQLVTLLLCSNFAGMQSLWIKSRCPSNRYECKDSSKLLGNYLGRLPKKQLYSLVWDGLSEGYLVLPRSTVDALTAEWVTLYMDSKPVVVEEAVIAPSHPALTTAQLDAIESAIRFAVDQAILTDIQTQEYDEICRVLGLDITNIVQRQPG